MIVRDLEQLPLSFDFPTGVDLDSRDGYVLMDRVGLGRRTQQWTVWFWRGIRRDAVVSGTPMKYVPLPDSTSPRDVVNGTQSRGLTDAVALATSGPWGFE